MSDTAEQIYGSASLTRNVFVDAGAGTGKTYSMVKRFTRLLVEKRVASVGEVVAITFTEKAAAELRSRIRDELQKILVENRETADESRLKRQLSDLDQAQIGTIHSFAHTILSMYPNQAGLPLEFAVLDESTGDETAAHLMDVAVGEANSYLENEVVRGRSKPVFVPTVSLQKTFAKQLLAQGVGKPCEASFLAEVLLTKAREVLHEIERDYGMVRDVFPADKFWEQFDLAAQLLTAENISLNGALSLFRVDRGSTANWNKALPPSVKDGLVEARHRLATVRELFQTARFFGHFGHKLIQILGKSAAQVDDRRRELGQISFNDLLTLTRDLLLAHPEIRFELAHRWPVIMLDEFQDTDPVQAQIALLIASARVDRLEDVPEVGENWLDLPLPGGSLFVVGDAKQSIYRFRNADVTLFKRMRKVFASRAAQGLDYATVTLDTNYRSNAELVDFNNRVCAQIFDSVNADLNPGSATSAFAENYNSEDYPVAVRRFWEQARQVVEPTLRDTQIDYHRLVPSRDAGSGTEGGVDIYYAQDFYDGGDADETRQV